MYLAWILGEFFLLKTAIVPRRGFLPNGKALREENSSLRDIYYTLLQGNAKNYQY